MVHFTKDTGFKMSQVGREFSTQINFFTKVISPMAKDKGRDYAFLVIASVIKAIGSTISVTELARMLMLMEIKSMMF